MSEPIEDLFAKIPLIVPPGKSHLEIEARFNIDSRKRLDINVKTFSGDKSIQIAKDLINKYSKNPTSVEQTINFINGSKVKQLVFIDGEQQKNKQNHYNKIRVIEPIHFLHNDLPSYRFGVSFEVPIEEFQVKDATSARIRLRYGIVMDSWRLDITLVKNLESFSNPSLLKDAKSKMFYKIDTNSFVEKAPWSFADWIEFEMEYIGNSETFSMESLKTLDRVFDKIQDIGVQDTDMDDGESNENPDAQLTYQHALYKIAKYIKPAQAKHFLKTDGMKQLSNQVIELDKNMYLESVADDIENYYITDKLDGRRAIVYLSDKQSFAVTDVLTMLDIKVDSTFILDTEFYEDHYYIFDVMVYDDETITNKPFVERLEMFEECKKLSPLFKTKPFIRLTEDYAKQIKDFKKEKKPYDTDGIVLTPYDGLYESMKVYKYKPIEKMTIDFLIKKCPEKLLGIRPYMAPSGVSLYLLFCGISSNVFNKLNMKFVRYYDDIFSGIDFKHLPRYFPVQFQASDKTYSYLYWDKNPDLDGEVGEFSYVGNRSCIKYCPQLPGGADDYIGGWLLHKLRSDRKIEVARGNYYGNNYRVVELVWMSYNAPLVIEELSLNNYFKKNDNPLQKASRSFNSFVKTKIFEQFKDTENVLDLASGKGQDLFRYGNNQMKNVTFLEIDNTALLELITRKHEFSFQNNRNRMAINVHEMNLLDDYKNNIERLADISMYPASMDLIICNFAFHYLIPDKKHLINICNFINHYIKPGGRFIFTAFDGKEIIQLLNKSNGNWTIKHGSEIKYSIKKDYELNILEPIGQKIKVLLPFSNNDYYEEYLVNIDYVSSELSKLGIIQETDQSFREYLAEYSKINKAGFTAMDENDKIYSGLYHYYGFYKQKPVEKTAGANRGRRRKIIT